MTVYKYVPNIEYKVNFSSDVIEISKNKIYVNETQSFELNFSTIFEAYEINKNDSWPMPNELFLKMLRGWTLELNEYFHLYRAQLNFAMFVQLQHLGSQRNI